MNPRFLICACCFLAAAPLTGIGDEKAKKTKNVEKQVSESGIVMTASMPEESMAGSAVNLRIRIQNKSKNEVIFTVMEKYSDYEDVKLLDAKGRPVPLTQFGALMYGGRRWRVGSSLLWRLGEGEHREDTLNLSRVFDLSEPGQYTLSISAAVAAEKTVKLKIEKLRFKVVEEP